MTVPREYDKPSKIVAKLGFLNEGELNQLRRDHTENYSRNIRITVPSFLAWVKFIDRSVGGYDDWRGKVDQYRRYVRGYVMNITALLSGISGLDTGQAVLRKFDGISFSVTISPESWNKFKLGVTMPARARDQRDVVAAHEWVRDDSDEVGTGKGADALIQLSPEAYAYSDLPGFTPDEALLHELVHAAFMVHGRLTKDRVNRGFLDEAEWFAILIANIYRSQKRKHDLLGSHEWREIVLNDTDNFLDNKKLHPSPRYLLDRLKFLAPILFDDIASIPVVKAKFNPIREYRDELNGLNGNVQPNRGSPP